MIEPTRKQIIQLAKTCKDCSYKTNNPDGGFCYMFEEKPPFVTNCCGQFKESKS